MSGQPYVVAIVLNWNNYEDTFKCLDSLQDIIYPNLDILLVDNGSTDQSAERLSDEFSEVETIYLDSNKGFGGGNSVGIKKAMNKGADYVWLLNNDIVVSDEDCLDSLVKTMESNGNLAFLSPIVTEYPNMEDIWFIKGGINQKKMSSHHIAEQDIKVGEDTEILYNSYIPFCSGLIRTDVIEDIGLYPERYYLYWGDVDYCIRALKSGYEIATDLTTSIAHKVTASSEGPAGPTYIYYDVRNRILLAREFTDMVSVYFIIHFTYDQLARIKGLIQHRKFSSISALLMGLVEGIFGRDGKGPYP